MSTIKEITHEEFKKLNPDGVQGFQTFYRDGLLVQRKVYEHGYIEEIRTVIKYYA
jgi:hypothetical protein